ncbi:calmodulin-like protein 6 [Manduca sexta]|uniref:calmodulin-like protein 6 n=1 Tax=Manduca sexta TaxID=7130 RepID=UPI0011837B39|nr:calmodulin-like protein 6 [Manduca sexta]
MTTFDVFNPLKNITPRFTDDQINEIVEWFDENSKPQLIINEGEPTPVITIQKFINFLSLKKFHRRNFHYPSYFEIMTEAENLKAGTTKMLTKDQFIYMLNKWVIEPNITHELLLAFKIFDTENRDFLEIDDLQIIVTGYGDVFNESETKEMLRDANVRGDGNVFYANFIQSLFSIAPELKDLKIEYLYDNPDEDPSVPPEPIIEEQPKPTSATVETGPTTPQSSPIPPPPAENK